MSQPGMNLKNMKMPTVSSGMIGGVAFFIVILLILYYVYTFLYTSQGVLSSINVVPGKVLDSTKLKNGGVIRCDAAKSITGGDSAVAQFPAATGLTSGGQYTVTMWLSVYSTSLENSPNQATIPLLDITARGKNTLLFIGLTPTNGTLMVHQGTGEAEDGTVGVRGMSPAAGSTSQFTPSDRCNIVNGIEYQRWILIGVVANGRTLDVYIDGKLSRSCVYKGLNSLGVGVTNGTADITVGRQNTSTGSINGVFSTTEYYNYALTPDLMWNIYQNGPATSSSSSFLSSMFSTNIDLSMGTAKN
jgi:hypothetical protein